MHPLSCCQRRQSWRNSNRPAQSWTRRPSSLALPPCLHSRSCYQSPRPRCPRSLHSRPDTQRRGQNCGDSWEQHRQLSGRCQGVHGLTSARGHRPLEDVVGRPTSRRSICAAMKVVEQRLDLDFHRRPPLEPKGAFTGRCSGSGRPSAKCCSSLARLCFALFDAATRSERLRADHLHAPQTAPAPGRAPVHRSSRASLRTACGGSPRTPARSPRGCS